jgi:hypothetical protein
MRVNPCTQEKHADVSEKIHLKIYQQGLSWIVFDFVSYSTRKYVQKQWWNYLFVKYYKCKFIFFQLLENTSDVSKAKLHVYMSSVIFKRISRCLVL